MNEFTPAEQVVLAYATYAHRDQKRKYTGEPYINHCINVARLVKEFGGTEAMVCAALLHDVVEDTSFNAWSVEHFLFGIRTPTHLRKIIVRYVEELTEHFTKERYSSMNRQVRKAHERDRLGKAPAEVQSIKLCDLIDNSSSILEHDPKFAAVYLREKADLSEVLTKGDVRLLLRARLIVEDGLAKLAATPAGV